MSVIYKMNSLFSFFSFKPLQKYNFFEKMKSNKPDECAEAAHVL